MKTKKKNYTVKVPGMTFQTNSEQEAYMVFEDAVNSLTQNGQTVELYKGNTRQNYVSATNLENLQKFKAGDRVGFYGKRTEGGCCHFAADRRGNPADLIPCRVTKRLVDMGCYSLEFEDGSPVGLPFSDNSLVAL